MSNANDNNSADEEGQSSGTVGRRFSDNYENNYTGESNSWKETRLCAGNDTQLSSASMTSDSEECAEDGSEDPATSASASAPRSSAITPPVNISISKAALYRQTHLYSHHKAASPPRPIPAPHNVNAHSKTRRRSRGALSHSLPGLDRLPKSPYASQEERWREMLERGTVDANNDADVQALRALRKRVESIRLVQQ